MKKKIISASLIFLAIFSFSLKKEVKGDIKGFKALFTSLKEAGKVFIEYLTSLFKIIKNTTNRTINALKHHGAINTTNRT